MSPRERVGARDYAMDVQDHLPLAPRDLLILAVLAEGPSHGYGLIKAVEERSESGVLLDPANLYRALRRMRELRWIEEAEGGDDRRRVRITDTGRAIVTAELGRLERLLTQARPALADGGRG
jgi:DNA-binding PadR family transcriptional regulator